MRVGAGHYAVLGVLVLSIGIVSLAARRGLVNVLAGMVVLLTAPVIALVGGAQLGAGASAPAAGEVLALLAVVSTGALVAVAAALLALVWRHRHVADVDELTDLRG